MARELVDENGKLRSKSEFFKAVKDKVDKDYNKKWLETEYNTAVASAQQARKWMSYVRKGGSITYVAVMDKRTRIEHAGWNGVTLPVTDVFWKNHFPPNGFNCRCTTRWAGTEAEDVRPTTFEDIPEAFQNNVGMTGKAFTDALPYFTTDGAFAKRAGELFGFKPAVDLAKFENNLLLYESLLKETDFKVEFTDNLSGGFVFSHVKKANDYSANLKAAKLLAIRGDAVVIRQVINHHGAINPDIELNSLLTEIKTNKTATANAIDQALKAAGKQATQVVLNIESNITGEKLKEAIKYRITRSTSIQNLIVIYKGSMYEFDRAKILMGDFWFKD